MNKEQFGICLRAHADTLGRICDRACMLHEAVNQKYDRKFPYGFHLLMVADFAMEYGHEVVSSEEDIIPVVFGAYFHDSIEDARLTYNDVRKEAEAFMDTRQALAAAEIVYALTNDKGRTRDERAGAHYYAGIRETPYAPFCQAVRQAGQHDIQLQGNGHRQPPHERGLSQGMAAFHRIGKPACRRYPLQHSCGYGQRSGMPACGEGDSGAPCPLPLCGQRKLLRSVFLPVRVGDGKPEDNVPVFQPFSGTDGCRILDSVVRQDFFNHNGRRDVDIFHPRRFGDAGYHVVCRLAAFVHDFKYHLAVFLCLNDMIPVFVDETDVAYLQGVETLLADWKPPANRPVTGFARADKLRLPTCHAAWVLSVHLRWRLPASVPAMLPMAEPR